MCKQRIMIKYSVRTYKSMCVFLVKYGRMQLHIIQLHKQNFTESDVRLYIATFKKNQGTCTVN